MGFLIFCVDDSHYMDVLSWEFMMDLGQDMNSLVLLSIKTTSKFYKHPAALNVLQHPTTMNITLKGLESQYIGALACQLLAVCKIPKRLEE